MQDIVLTCCRDEVDVIETFICFYLKMGFDRVYVIDNGSSDGTREAVQQLIARNTPLTLMEDSRRGYEKHLTENYHNVARDHLIRWLFYLDCDEFIFFENGFKQYLDSLDYGISRLRIRQREMYPDIAAVNSKGNFLLSVRAAAQMEDTTKDITCYHPQARVFGGKHLIDFPGAVTYQPENIFIRHYKYRSIAQALKKEKNRIWAHASYSDKDLEMISAFGVTKSRKWIKYCMRAHRNRTWMNRFDGNVDYVVDDVLASWARPFLKDI